MPKPIQYAEVLEVELKWEQTGQLDDADVAKLYQFAEETRELMVLDEGMDLELKEELKHAEWLIRLAYAS